jgi:spore maturation protein CgeB
MSSALNILYLGNNNGTSRLRAEALRRLGHNVQIIDPWQYLTKVKLLKKILDKITIELGPEILESWVLRTLKKKIRGSEFDVIWNNQCELIGSNAILALKKHAEFLVTYVNDDPFGTRDKQRFSLYRPSLKHYDLCVVVRPPNVAEAFASGASKVLRVHMSADEIAHRPLAMPPEEKRNYATDVAFIGTWMPERGPFLAKLIALGVPLTVYGDRWQKAPEWSILKRVWRGSNLVDAAYVKAIQSAKVCIGLLSEGNRDQHTTRSMEIPYIGSVLCAKRTREHAAMYRENDEAVFWSTPEECAKKSFWLLSNEANREAIAKAGRERCIANGHLNEPTMEKIIDTLIERAPLSTGFYKIGGAY